MAKRVVSLSLGSSRRDKRVTLTFRGETFDVERVGVDGDLAAFARRLSELDGNVDAIGFGGMDRYVVAGGRRYEFTSARRLLAGAKRTPVVDGSGLKNTLERAAVETLASEGIVDFARRRTLIVCGVDRFGLSEAVASYGGPLVFGDLMFALGVPFAIRGATLHRNLARVLLPALVRLPLSALYPMGAQQESIVPRWERWYRWAEVIAGDFHYIRRHLPTPESGALAGKIILTNTTTPEDRRELSRRGARLLITTTPARDGRTFGTNVLEAVLVAHYGRPPSEAEYADAPRAWGLRPEVFDLTTAEATVTAGTATTA
jgi:hypothetical protein